MHLFEGLDTHFVHGAIERDRSRWRRWLLQALNVIRSLAALPGEIWFLRRMRADHGIALVHVNSIVALTAGLAARLLGLPVIWHVREILAEGVWPRMARRGVLASADHIIAVSEAAARPFRGSNIPLHVVHNPIHVIHNAVDLSGFEAPADPARVRHDLGLPPGVPVVGFVGKLFSTKGAIDLVRAAPLIRRQIPGVCFLIVGGSDAQATGRAEATWTDRARWWLGFGEAPDNLDLLRSEAERLGIADCLHLVGSRSDVPRVLAAMDVVALPSHTEAFGRTVIEAMAASRPVVSVAIDGIPELIRDGENGVLVAAPPRPEELARAIVALLRDEGKRRALGRAARASVVERFSASDHAARIVSVYEEILTHIGRQDQMRRTY
jgi:glycosyltransferase involved in cell wall biosynthesis